MESTEIPWDTLTAGFVGLFLLMALVLIAVDWLRRGASVSGGTSDD